MALTAIRIVRHDAKATARDPREAWFWWIGGPLPPPEALPGYYARRFGKEHGYKFQKQVLLWDAPRVRTPEQFARWSDLVAIAHNHLVLARPLATVAHRPWESRTKPTTPQQVRRALPRILAQVGTPVRPPRPGPPPRPPPAPGLNRPGPPPGRAPPGGGGPGRCCARRTTGAASAPVPAQIPRLARHAPLSTARATLLRAQRYLNVND